ncbi:MAG: DUF3019 domain-containing protein [Cellvibrionaceae bacterium]|nr:DUF3019 domain-containing protein [Cellvibrionaceae bacterium]
MKLNIKPRICVLAQGEKNCEDKINIRWSTKDKHKLSACLFKGEATMPIRCWQNRRSGIYKIAIETDRSLMFTLRNSSEELLLAQKEFEVVHDSKRYRRSRRNPWSFF